MTIFKYTNFLCYHHHTDTLEINKVLNIKLQQQNIRVLNCNFLLNTKYYQIINIYFKRRGGKSLI